MRNANSSAVLALLVFSGGCTLLYEKDAEQRQCSQDSDCDSLAKGTDAEGTSFLCLSRVCQAVECRVAEDCAVPDGSVASCVANTCVLADAAPSVKACSNNSDCESGELCSPKDGTCYEKWGCLDDESDWLSSESKKTEFSYRALMRSLQNPDDDTLLGELTVNACSSSDIDCSRPAVANAAVMKTDDQHITVPFKNVGINGFMGTIRVQAALPGAGVSDAGVAEEVLPGYFHFTSENPLVNETIAQDRAILIDTGTASSLSSFADVPDITLTANVIFLLYDCGGNKASDLSIGVKNASGFRFISLRDEQNPDFGATSTSSYGAAFVAAAPEGFQTFVIKDEKQNRIVTDTFAFNVIKNGINYVQYYPRYSALKKWMEYAEANPDQIP